MATDFSTHLLQPDVQLACYIYIEGIPYIFSNIAAPSGWGLGDYTWSQTFRWFGAGESQSRSKLESIGTKSDLVGGVSVSGEVDLEFLVDPTMETGTWRDLLFPPTLVTGFLKGAGTDSPVIYPDGVVWDVIADGTIAAGADWYVGTETARVEDVESGLYVVERGKYDSRPKAYSTELESTPSEFQSLTRVSSAPQSWRHRVVSVYLTACGVDSAGALVPLDSARSVPDGDTATFSRQVFRGPIADLVWQPGMTSLTITAQSIEQLLEGPAVQTARRYRMGPESRPAFGGWVYLERGVNDVIDYDATETFKTKYDAATTTPSTTDNQSGILYLTDYIGGEGLYTTTEVVNGVADMLNSVLGEDSQNNYYYQFEAFEGDTGKYVLSCTEWVGAYSQIDQPFTIRHRPDSALVACGQTADLVIPTHPMALLTSPSSNTASTRMDLQGKPFAYSLHPQNTRLYYHGVNRLQVGLDNPPRKQGTSSRGVEDLPRVRIGKHEIAEVEFYDTSGGRTTALNSTGTADNFYMDLVRRDLTGAQKGALLIKQGQETEPKNDIVLGLYFDDHDLLDVLRSMAISTGGQLGGGGWDTLPYAYGAGIPDDYFDHDSFDQVQEETAALSAGWWLEEGQSLRKLFQMVGTAYQISFYPAVVDGKYVISCKTSRPALTLPAGGVHIDLDWYNPLTHKATADKSERDVVNRISWEFAYNPLTRKYEGSANNSTHDGSVKVYGPSKPLKVQIPWVFDRTNATHLIHSLSFRVFGEYADPPVNYGVTLVNHQSYDLDAKQVIAYTHAHLPDWSARSIGFNQKVLEIQNKSDAYGPGIGATTTIEMRERRADGLVYYPYCPSLRILENITGDEYRVAVDWRDGGFSESGTTDLSHFADAVTDSWELSVYRDYDESDILQRSFSAIDTDAGTVTFDAALSGSWSEQDVTDGYIVVTFYLWGAVVTSQDNYAYYSDHDNGLSGGEPARRWA